MQSVVDRSACALLASLLVSCGGGGGGDSSQTPPTSAQTQVLVRFGDSVPNSTMKLITSITSSIGDAAPGSALAITSSAPESLVVAGNATNDILLLAVGSDAITLDENSTALAMVRIAIDKVYLSEEETGAQIVTAIQAANQYSQLVLDIKAAIATGTPPVEASAVLSSVWAVAAVAKSNLQKSSSSHAHVLGASVDAEPPFPAYFINQGNTNRVLLNDVNGPGLNLVNGTLIPWVVASCPYPEQCVIDSRGSIVADAIGSAVAAPSSGDYSAALALLLFGVSDSITTVNGSSEGHFNVTLAQSEATRLQTAIAFVTRFTALIFSAGTAAVKTTPGVQVDCLVAIAGSVINERLRDFATQPTGEAAKAYFLSRFPFDQTYWRAALAAETYGLLSACGAAPKIEFKDIFGARLAKFYTLLKLATQAAQIGDIANISVYYSFNQTLHVCKSGGVVRFCEIELSLAPTNSTLKVGQTLALLPTATNLRGATVQVPTQVKWSSSNESVATVDSFGTVTAKSSGPPVAISIADSISGHFATASVVVEPGISSYRLTANGGGVDDILVVDLVDSSSKAIIKNIISQTFGTIADVVFTAQRGQTLHIVAKDNSGGACYALSPLSIINITPNLPQGTTQQITAGAPSQCSGQTLGPSPYIYLDQYIEIGI